MMQAPLALAGLLLAVPAFARCVDPERRTRVPAQRGPACAIMWDVGGTAVAGRGKRPWRLTCTDGDAGCDADGASNGVCRFNLAACLNVPQDGCPVARVSRLRLANPGKRMLPALLDPPLANPGCGSRSALKIPLASGRRVRPAKRVVLTLRGRSTAGPIRNAVELQCVASAAPVFCQPRASSDEPSMARLQFPPSGGDLEPGSAGVAPIPGIAACATLTFCLTGCDASSNARCDASGSIGNTSLNGVYAGPPQPTISGGVPVCLVHRWEHDITGTIALDDGSVSLDVGLLTDVYLTSASEPCPICESTGDLGSVGRCSATARTPGVSCLLEARDETSGRGLSSSCLPATPVAAVSRVEFPLTTGAARLPLNSAPACLEGAPPARIGNASVPQPPWPEPSYPKTATGVLLVGAFCATPTAQLPLGSPIPPSRGRMTLPVDALTVYGPP